MAEVNAIIDWLRKNKGTVISANNIFNGPLINILWATVSGQRCDWTNEKEAGTVRMQEEFLRYTNSSIFYPHKIFMTVCDICVHFIITQCLSASC